MVDLIRDGVSKQELRGRGTQAVWNALVRTACSAMQRRWSCDQWATLVNDPRSHLGRQASINKGRPVDLNKMLVSAWSKAEQWLANKPPPFTREDAIAHAKYVLAWAAHPNVDLPSTVRTVLVFAAEEGIRYGTTRPALPRRLVAEKAGLGERQVRTALTWLERCDLLILDQRGRPAGADALRRRANLYLLPSQESMNSYQCRETRPVGPTAQFYGSLMASVGGTHSQVYGTPRNRVPQRGPRSHRLLCSLARGSAI